MHEQTVIEADGPVLIFGGPYSNLQATRAVLAEARRLGIPPARTICTGDLVAYCGDPLATIGCVADSGIAVVMGNCDEQLGLAADSCACGYPAGSTCERLSTDWYAQASALVGAAERAWLAALPRRLNLRIGGRRLAVIHGGVSAINRFVFATTPPAVKREELARAGCDGVIGGHCGLPFSELVDGRLWHNAGVVGMPANDGTPRTWFSVLTPMASGIRIDHRALDYDHAAAAQAMQRAGLPEEYRLALASGLWPSGDVLPPREARARGVALAEGSVTWAAKDATAARRDGLLWPDLLGDGSTKAPAAIAAA